MTQAVLHSVREGDRPEGADVRVVCAPDGIELRVAFWPAPENRAQRGTFFVFPGYTEFIEKYYEVVARLRTRGFAVVVFDWRGQGLSTHLLPNRFKGHVDDYADFVSDAFSIYEEVVCSFPRPHHLLGHSMGGHLALRFLQDFPGRIERAVLSAPMLGWGAPQAWAMHLLSSVGVLLGQGSSYTWLRGDPDPNHPVNNVTTDEERFRRTQAFYQEAPDLRLGGPTWRWVQQASSSIARIMDRERLIRVKVPILVASAEHDEVISSERHADLPFLNTTFTVLPVPDAKHEILQETDAIQERFWKGFDQFVG